MSWPIKPLGEVATLQRGFDLPTQNRLDGSIPIYAANGRVGFHSEVRVAGPGVVTGRSGSIGKVHYVKGGYWPLNTALYVKDFHGNDPKYIYWLLRELRLERFHHGTGVPTLNRNVVHLERVPVPPLSEQRRIAAILDKADALRAKRREAIAKLDQLLQSVFLDMFGDPIRNERGFPLMSLADAVEQGRPITYGILKPGPDIHDGVPYIRVVDIRDGAVLVNSVKRTSVEIAYAYRRSEVRGGDVLMSIRGHVGRIGVVPEELENANITQDTARISVNSKFESRYISGLLNTQSAQDYMARFTRGAAVQGINLKDVREIPIPVPPKPDQARYAEMVRRIGKLKVSFVEQLHQSNAMFSGLQSLVFPRKV